MFIVLGATAEHIKFVKRQTIVEQQECQKAICCAAALFCVVCTTGPIFPGPDDLTGM
jgi:hypothetical protein